MNFLIGDKSCFSSEQLKGIHSLRYKVFRCRLQWDVPTAGEEELDEYDVLNPVIFAAFDNYKRVRGCCRILPTTGSYMLRDTFPSLLGSVQAPHDVRTWEISRFAIDKVPTAGIGFSTVPAWMIAHLVRYALLGKIEHYVFATTVGFERLLRRMKVNCERVSTSELIGNENCVALQMHIDSTTISAVSSVAPKLFDAFRKVA